MDRETAVLALAEHGRFRAGLGEEPSDRRLGGGPIRYAEEHHKGNLGHGGRVHRAADHLGRNVGQGHRDVAVEPGRHVRRPGDLRALFGEHLVHPRASWS